MVTIKNTSRGKIAFKLTTLSVIALSFTACGPNNNAPPLFGGGGDFNLQGLMVTKINTDKTTVSSSLKWNAISGADHYELSRVQNNGSPVNIGPSKIAKEITNFSDPNLQEEAAYKYTIFAIDANNKVITKGETSEIKPITSTDLKGSEIQGLKPPPDSNTVTRETTFKWSSVANSDIYYASIVNNSSSKQIFGVFTKDTSVNINVGTSPINPPDIIKQELPILTGGLEKEVRHKLSIYSIKFNNADLNKATAIGLRQSPEVYLIL